MPSGAGPHSPIGRRKRGREAPAIRFLPWKSRYSLEKEGAGGEKSAAMAGPMLGVVGEWRARRCLRGWVCGGEGSGDLVELFGGAVGGGDLVVGVWFGPK